MECQLSDLVSIIKKLREECPWDKSQTLYSAKLFLPEEAYEVVSAIVALEDKRSGAKDRLKEELGDLLIQVLFHIIIGEEENLFSFEEVISAAKAKLKEKHPHVFGNIKRNKEEVLFFWEKDKKGKKDEYLSKNMPALLLASVYYEKSKRLKRSRNNLISNLKKQINNLEFQLKKGKVNLEEAICKSLFYLVGLGRDNSIDLEFSLKEYLRKLSIS